MLFLTLTPHTQGSVLVVHTLISANPLTKLAAAARSAPELTNSFIITNYLLAIYPTAQGLWVAPQPVLGCFGAVGSPHVCALLVGLASKSRGVGVVHYVR